MRSQQCEKDEITMNPKIEENGKSDRTDGKQMNRKVEMSGRRRNRECENRVGEQVRKNKNLTQSWYQRSQKKARAV
jgi:hypothetical protein